MKMNGVLLICVLFSMCSSLIAQSGSSVFGEKETIPAAFKGDIYYLPENTAKLPDFSTLQPVGAIYTKSLNISPRSFNSGFPGVTDRTEWFAIQYNGAFLVLTEGEYSFRIHSDDGSKLYVDNKLVIDNDGIHPPRSKMGTIVLQRGIHSIRVEYFQGPRYNIALQLYINIPGKGETLFVTDAEATTTATSGSAFGTTQRIEKAFKGDIYYVPINTAKLPDFSALKPVGSIYTKTLDIEPRQFEKGFPGVTERNEWFAIQYNGAFNVAVAGEYTFRIHSDDGSKLYIDNTLVIDNDGVHAPSSAMGSMLLSQGVHAIRVEYFQGPRYDIALQLFIAPPGKAEEIFSTNADFTEKKETLTTPTTPTKKTPESSIFGVLQAVKGAFKGDIYYIPVNTTKLPDFSTLQPVGSVYTKKLDISPRKFEEGFPGMANRNEWFAIQYHSNIVILLPGEYQFRLLSDDGSKLYIDDKLVIDNDGLHSPQEKTGVIRLAPGRHKIRVEYFQGPRYDIALQLFITPPKGKEMIFESR